MGLMILNTTYHQIMGNFFARPVNSGLLPINITCTSTQMSEQVRQHKEELRVFRQVVNTDLALKSQLIDVFDKTYFRGLRDRHTGFTNVTYLQMTTHLYDHYGIISVVYIMENEKKWIHRMTLQLTLNHISNKLKMQLNLQPRAISHSQRPRFLLNHLSRCFQPGFTKTNARPGTFYLRIT